MLTLYTIATGNGYRASIMLEECGLDYEVKTLNLAEREQKSPEFLKINPAGKLPALVDPEGPDGQPVMLGETLAIALYLCEKTGKLMPATAAGRAQAWQWAAITATGFGQALAGTFFAKTLDEAAHQKIITKYAEDIDLLLASMDQALAQRPYLAGDTYSFADVLAFPVCGAVIQPMFGKSLEPYPAIRRWQAEIAARPAVIRGLAVPPKA